MGNRKPMSYEEAVKAMVLAGPQKPLGAVFTPLDLDKAQIAAGKSSFGPYEASTGTMVEDRVLQRCLSKLVLPDPKRA